MNQFYTKKKKCTLESEESQSLSVMLLDFITVTVTVSLIHHSQAGELGRVVCCSFKAQETWRQKFTFNAYEWFVMVGEEVNTLAPSKSLSLQLQIRPQTRIK